MATKMGGPVPLQKARAMGKVSAVAPTGQPAKGGPAKAPMKGAMPFKKGGKAGC